MLIDRNDITAKVLCSSICVYTKTRVDTLQLRYPRVIHSEVMTHRAFSRNASSSRAIPVASMIARSDVFIPNFKYNKPGMQPAELLSVEDQKIAGEIWQEMVDFCMTRCQLLSDRDGLNVAKQWANRPLEWFGYIDVVITATDWANWDALRDHPAAQDEIQILARKIRAARDSVIPKKLREGDWHLPYITREDIDFVDFHCDPRHPELLPPEVALITSLFSGDFAQQIPPRIKLLIAISAARCCRVSYAKHDGENSSLAEDVRRCLLLVQPGQPVHSSPFEHQATVWDESYASVLKSNLRNLLQFRKCIPNEAVFDAKEG